MLASSALAPDGLVKNSLAARLRAEKLAQTAYDNWEKRISHGR